MGEAVPRSRAVATGSAPLASRSGSAGGGATPRALTRASSPCHEIAGDRAMTRPRQPEGAEPPLEERHPATSSTLSRSPRTATEPGAGASHLSTQRRPLSGASRWRSSASGSTSSGESFDELEREAQSALEAIAAHGDHVTPLQCAAYRSVLTRYRDACALRENYRASKLVHDVLQHLRREEEGRHVRGLAEQQLLEREVLEESSVRELTSFHAIWNERIDQFEEESLQAETQLVERQNREWEAFFHSVLLHDPGLASRQSRRHQDVQRTQHVLASLGEYALAEQKKHVADTLAAANQVRNEEERGKSVAQKESLLAQRHQHEHHVLCERVEARRLGLERSRKRELDLLLQRYINARRDLELQQSLVRSRTGVVLLKHASNTLSSTSGIAALVASVSSGAFGSAIRRRSLGTSASSNNHL